MVTERMIDWQDIQEAPRDQLLLLWVHGLWVGRWSHEHGGRWIDRNAIELAPVRYWAPINPPT